MASVRADFDGHTLEITTEVIDVTPLAEPDPKWTFTDAAGHRHYWSDTESGGPYPTLEYRTVHDHADDEECDADDDQDLCYPVLCCKQCGQPVAPGTRPPSSRRIVPGLRTYLIDGEPVSKQAAEDFMAARKAEALAAAPETYHGVTVPEKIRLVWNRPGSGARMWQAGVRAGLGLEDPDA